MPGLILGISGSPRKNGNTDAAVIFILKKLEMLTSRKTEFIRICDLEIKPCLGCRACMRNMECAIREDDFYPLWNKIVSSDLVIIGAPVYWYSPPGPVKDFIDRTHAWYACPQKFPVGKKMGLISIAADSGFETHEEIMAVWANYYGIEVIDKVRILAREKGDLGKNNEHMNNLNKFTSNVMKSLDY
jgi:multimeric flavodoxin WrbA